MTVGIRGRLLLVSLLVVVLVGLPIGLFLEHRFRELLEERSVEALSRLCGLGAELIERVPALGGLEETDAIADSLGRAASARVTLIDETGRVLGDSEVEVERVRALEPHGDRPEVREALRDGRGSSRRWSATLGRQMLYVAERYERGDGSGVVRVARAESSVSTLVRQLRIVLLLAALMVLGMAVLVGGLSSHLTARRLRLLVDHAREVAGGKGRIALAPGDELGKIAGSFNKMASALDRAVDGLARERDRLGTILESMGDAVLAVDAEHRITLVNPAARELLRMKRDPLGEPIADAVSNGELVSLVKGLGEGSDAEREIELKEADFRRVLARIRPLRVTGGAVVVMHDVTEMRRLERVRRDFVANVSHELRTPVSVVSANAETLLDGAMEEPELATTFTEAILRNAQRLSRIIGDLLDLSRIEAGTYELELRPVRLSHALRRAMEAVTPAVEDKEMTITNTIAPRLEAFADPVALDHVLLNLIDNAVKYGERGGHVVARATEQGELVRVEVLDDGPGIKPKYRQRVFERFYRVDKGRSREMGGTGLGLSITKHLVENMGGEVGVEPNEPKGSIFWFTLRASPERFSSFDGEIEVGQ